MRHRLLHNSHHQQSKFLIFHTFWISEQKKENHPGLIPKQQNPFFQKCNDTLKMLFKNIVSVLRLFHFSMFEQRYASPKSVTKWNTWKYHFNDNFYIPWYYYFNFLNIFLTIKLIYYSVYKNLWLQLQGFCFFINLKFIVDILYFFYNIWFFLSHKHLKRNYSQLFL